MKAAKITGATNRFGQTALSMELATKLFLYRETGINSIFSDVELWPNLTKADNDKLESIHTGNLKILMGLPKTTPNWGSAG